LPESGGGEARSCKKARVGGVQLSVVMPSTALGSRAIKRGLCEGDTYGLAFVGVFFASFLFRRWKKK
jgi:hypothetical protein